LGYKIADDIKKAKEQLFEDLKKELTKQFAKWSGKWHKNY